MTLPVVVTITALIVGLALLSTVAVCVRLDRLRNAGDDSRRRVREITPYVAIAAGAFLFKQLTHEASLELSRTLDWNITGTLYAAEGLFVANLQASTPEASFGFFSVMYMFGFPYLLLVPVVLYFLLPSQRRLKQLLVAYVLNYAIGALCYTLFIAYGPRNWIDEHVEGTMYQLYPETQELTAAVSSNTDVFPSLHTSMAVVALVFAWKTRQEYPRWFPLAAAVTACVVLSTMVLGIHWLSDVVAGVVLGVGSVIAARWIVARLESYRDVGQALDETGLPTEADD